MSKPIPEYTVVDGVVWRCFSSPPDCSFSKIDPVEELLRVVAERDALNLYALMDPALLARAAHLIEFGSALGRCADCGAVGDHDAHDSHTPDCIVRNIRALLGDQPAATVKPGWAEAVGVLGTPEERRASLRWAQPDPGPPTPRALRILPRLASFDPACLTVDEIRALGELAERQSRLIQRHEERLRGLARTAEPISPTFMVLRCLKDHLGVEAGTCLSFIEEDDFSDPVRWEVVCRRMATREEADSLARMLSV